MSVVKHFIEDSMKKAEIDEFLKKEFERAGYGGVSITKTPLGTHLVVYTMRPGLVIGRGGETIRALATILEEKFELPSPQISVAEIEVPELNAYIVASRIASALKRGIHYRRAGFWGLTQAMQAGALGIEIKISGKLRTDRARYEKFSEGYLPKSGEPPRKYMRKAELHVQLKPGTLGVKVCLIPPEAVFPDQVKVHVIEEELNREPEKEIVNKTEVTEEKIVETEVSPIKETVEKTVTEPTAPSAEEKIEPTKKTVKSKTPSAESKKVTTEKEVTPLEKKVEAKNKVGKSKVEASKKKLIAKKKVEQKVVPKKKTVKTATKPKTKKSVAKKVAKSTVAPVVEGKNVPKKKAAKSTVSLVKKKALPKKKVTKPKATPVKEKKPSRKKAVKKEAPSVEIKKEAGA